MKILKLDQESLERLREIGEAGMDFYIVTGTSEDLPRDVPVAIRSNGYLLPLRETNGVYSLLSMLEGQPFPAREDEREISMRGISTVSAMSAVSLPTGYLSSYGAHQLLVTVTLSHPAKFFRYTSTVVDPRFTPGAGATGSIRKDTYLTSFNDQLFVNSGFGAVGRYALPIPAPASYVHSYTLLPNTTLLVGTVAPQFGQAGGGVEVKTINSETVVLNGTHANSDY